MRSKSFAAATATTRRTFTSDLPRREYMAAALKMVEEEFGGVENYLTMRCGLSTEDLAVLRKNLLADVEPIL